MASPSEIMAEDGVTGLTMARLARAMDIRPPPGNPCPP